MDDLEKELLDYDEMSTSVSKITNPQQRSNDSNRSALRKDVRDMMSTNSTGCATGNCNAQAGRKNISDFVEDLEKNLDNFDNIKTSDGPLAANINFEKDLVDEDEEIAENEVPPEEDTYDIINKKIYEFLINMKEPFIIILLFILLNNRDFIMFIYQLPFINRINSVYPSLIIRGAIMAIIIFYLRKLG